YATGGVAGGEVQSSYSFMSNQTAGAAVFAPAQGAGSFSTTKWGWTAGAGVETMLPWMSSRWSAKLEYLYVDLGTITNTLTIPLSGALTGTGAYNYVSTIHVRDNLVRVGLNYRFGG